MNNTLIDLRILDNHPEALAKITEALARVYFDNVLIKGFDIEPIDKAYTTSRRLCPNYRIILQDRIEKYKLLNPIFATIISTPFNPYTK